MRRTNYSTHSNNCYSVIFFIAKKQFLVNIMNNQLFVLVKFYKKVTKCNNRTCF